MTALIVIGAIILFFVLVFSIPLYFVLDYDEKTTVVMHWLFLKIKLFDSSTLLNKKEKTEKEPKKEKKPKKSKGKEEPAAAENEETVAEKAEPAEKAGKGKKSKEKKKSPGLFMQLYHDQGYEGLKKMLQSVGKALGGFFGKLWKTFTVDEIYLYMRVTGGDAADTAQKYGILCSWLYPVLGKLVSTCKVKKYDADVSADFLGRKSVGTLYSRFHVIPLRIINAAVVLAFSLLFRVIFKILFADKKSKKAAMEAAEKEKAEDKAGNAESKEAPAEKAG